MTMMNADIFRRVMGWEQQHINKLSSGLKKLWEPPEGEWSKDPVTLTAQLFEKLSDPLAFAKFHAFVQSTTFDPRNRERNHQDKNLFKYFVTLRWYQRGMELVATGEEKTLNDISNDVQSVSNDARPLRLCQHLRNIPGAEDFITCYEWFAPLINRPDDNNDVPIGWEEDAYDRVFGIVFDDNLVASYASAGKGADAYSDIQQMIHDLSTLSRQAMIDDSNVVIEAVAKILVGLGYLAKFDRTEDIRKELSYITACLRAADFAERIDWFIKSLVEVNSDAMALAVGAVEQISGALSKVVTAIKAEKQVQAQIEEATAARQYAKMTELISQAETAKTGVETAMAELLEIPSQPKIPIPDAPEEWNYTQYIIALVQRAQATSHDDFDLAAEPPIPSTPVTDKGEEQSTDEPTLIGPSTALAEDTKPKRVEVAAGALRDALTTVFGKLPAPTPVTPILSPGNTHDVTATITALPKESLTGLVAESKKSVPVAAEEAPSEAMTPAAATAAPHQDAEAAASPEATDEVALATVVETPVAPVETAVTTQPILAVEPESAGPAEPHNALPALGEPAVSALEGCFSACDEGRYDVAFWLSWLAHRNNEPEWSHEAFTAYVFGNRILPGGFIGGELGSSLSALAQEFPDASHNRVLVAGALMAPILFCADKPASIYALREQAETGLPKFDELLTALVDLGMNKAIYLTPSDVMLAGASTDHSKELEELAAESANELHKARVSKMAFWPGECLIHAIYRDGMPLASLHAIVTGNERNRIQEAKNLLETISPDLLAESYELAPGLVPGRCPPMIGPARAKFMRYVNTTLGLARRWVELTEESSGTVDNFRRKEIEALRTYVRKAAPAVIAEIQGNVGRGNAMMDAALQSASFTVKRISNVLAGEPLQVERDIYTMLAPHPGVRLDDDFMPVVGAEDDLVNMLQYGLKPNPELAFEEALRRSEFVRAKYLIDTFSLPEPARDEFDEMLEKTSSDLLFQIYDLETRVEDAYLLGELTEFEKADTAKDGNGEAGKTAQHVTRSGILGKLMSARAILTSIRSADEPRMLEVIAKIGEVAAFTDRIKEASQLKMQQRSIEIANAFPETPEGQEDREYFVRHFLASMDAGDQVAAAEIIHQAENAQRAHRRLAQTQVSGCAIVREFEAAEAQITEALQLADLRLDHLIRSIKDCKPAFGLPYNILEKPQRDSAAKTLEGIQRAREGSASDSTPTLVPLIVAALGVETVGEVKIRQRGNDYRVVDVALRFNPTCPVPAFGSELKRKLTVLLLTRKYTEDEIRELVGQLGLKRSPLLVLSLHPISTLMRHRLRALCAQDQMQLLMVDLVNLLFILSRANRQQTLFDVTLPFAYCQPYQMKGENVPEETFVGREKEVNSLLDKDGACIVFGGRQLGKSATLRHLVNKHHDPKSHRFILYRDIDDLGAGTEAYEKVRSMFWEYVANEVTLAEFADLRSTVAKGSHRLEAAVTQAIKEAFAKNPSLSLTLLLDEADDLINLDAQHDFGLIKTIRGLMVDTNRQFKAVFAGLQSVQQFQRWKNHPFAQLGREIVISPLPPEAAQRLVVNPMRALGFEFESPELVLRIMSTVNYHPGLMQIFCHRLLSRYYEKATRQKKVGGAVRVITREDLREVERNPELTEDIRDRFDWTLDLDDRYKVLVYALVLSGNPTDARSESEFRKLGAYWWGAEFAAMDLASIRSLLEEMEGLGVLVRTDTDGSRTYQLRSPNLLRLLGNRDVIEHEMERLIAQQSRRKANPREFHHYQGGKGAHFSAFSMGQEAEMFSRAEAFGVTLVFGSRALGVTKADDNISRVAKGLGEGQDAWSRKEVGEQFMGNVERFSTEVVKFFRPRERKHFFINAPAELLTTEMPLNDVVREIQFHCKSACSKNSKGRVFLTAGPSALWAWLVERRVHAERSPQAERRAHAELRASMFSELVLQPWSDGAVWKALEVAGIRNKAKQYSSEILDKTGGFHFLIEDLISECRTRDITSADAALPVLEEKLTGIEASDVHELFGITEMPEALRCVTGAMFPLVLEQDKKTGLYTANRAAMSVVVAELDVDQWREIFGDLGVDMATDVFIQWMTHLGLLRGTSHSADEFMVPSVVAKNCFIGC